MKFRRSSASIPAGALAAGVLCLGVAMVVLPARANPGGFQHPPLGSAAIDPAARSSPPPIPRSKQVDVNNASRADLMKLPGIGAAEADRIVKGRPYLSKAALVTQQVLPMATFDALHRNIYVGPVKGKTDARIARAAKAASQP